MDHALPPPAAPPSQPRGPVSKTERWQCPEPLCTEHRPGHSLPQLLWPSQRAFAPGVPGFPPLADKSRGQREAAGPGLHPGRFPRVLLLGWLCTLHLPPLSHSGVRLSSPAILSPGATPSAQQTCWYLLTFSQKHVGGKAANGARNAVEERLLSKLLQRSL